MDEKIWTHLDWAGAAVQPERHTAEPAKRGRYRLDRTRIETLLAKAPLERVRAGAGVEVTLPLPDGRVRRFVVKESPVMEEGLARKFPHLRTYAGHAVEDSAQRVRLNLTPHGLHASILGRGPQVFVDPVDADSSEHISYYKESAARSEDGFECLAEATYSETLISSVPSTVASASTLLRTARLAVAATGEYTAFHGGTKDGALTAIVTAVNRLNSIYETELALRFLLVANNDLILFTNAATDPYSGSDALAMLGQNQSTIDALIGTANYDVGHVFSTGGGGLAQVGGACVAGWKAQGVTGRASPMGDPFYIDYVAHELGHQFGAHHTFNGALGNCSANNRHAATAYEPGSGSTVMAYAGLCGGDNVQMASDAYFHSASLLEIQALLATSGLSSESVPNEPPVVEAGVNRVIPQGTPFVLTAQGWDAEGDTLSYSWEQWDLGPAALLAAPDSGAGPLFRSRPPEPEALRWFPDRTELLVGGTAPGETLPQTDRVLHFAVTARDGQSTGMDSMQITVAGSAGPFQVNQPEGGSVCSVSATVIWDVAGTDQAPVSAETVDILLSTNGGWDFPIILASHTPNDGSEPVTLPDAYSEEARVMVRASDNVFFDVSPSDFTLHPHAGPPEFVLLDVEIGNPTQILIPAANTAGNASVYPASITVDESEGVIEDVAVILHGLAHGWTPDLDILLVPPAGSPIVLLSDVDSATPLVDAELKFSDTGAVIPEGLPGSGHFQPTNVGLTGDVFPVAGPYAPGFSELKGLSPSGTWSLYVRDDAKDDVGLLDGGWTLQLTIRRLAPGNQPPVLVTDRVRFVHEGALLHVVPEANDPDGDRADLTFEVSAAQPQGVELDPDTGSLSWRPGPGTAGMTNAMVISVTDSGTPEMTATSVLDAVVVAPVTLQMIVNSNAVVDLVWSAAPGTLYELESATDLTGGWEKVAGPVGTAGFECSVNGLSLDQARRFFRVRVLE